MILYHGSNVAIERVDLSLALPYKDFGRGFYLTSMLEQFTGGYITEERLRDGLEFKRASDQYSFHTERAVALLEPRGSWRVR